MTALLRSNLTAENLRDMLRHGASTVAFSALIAVGLWLSGRGPFHMQMVYSVSIGLISWLVIDIGRLALSQDQEKPWPHGVRGVVLVAVGAFLGFLGGKLIGDAYSGLPFFEFRAFASDQVASTLIMTGAACVAICYYYYSRGRSNYLQSAVAIAQRDATEARLKLLETQLEPHMLFNTLSNLRVLIATDPPRAIAMLDRLNSYLRVTLAGSRALSHPLAAEFDRLADYLSLMAVRMDERLHFELDLPEHLRQVPVPPLLLQPLVENSIRHGLEPKVAGGSIRVQAREDGDLLCIEVLDTGVGLPADVPPQAGPGGFGLAQVRERLQTVYAGRAQLLIDPAPGGGTRARVLVPRPA